MPDFHVTFRDLLHAVNLRHGTNGFTYLPMEGVLRIFSAWKIRRLRPGLNPRTRPPKPLNLRVCTRRQKDRKACRSRIQASDAMCMSNWLFWGFTEGRMTIPYRRFWSTYRSHLQGSSLTKPVMQTKFGIKPQHHRTACPQQLSFFFGRDINKKRRVPLLSLSRELPLSRDWPPDAGFLRDKTDVIKGTIKDKPLI